MSSLRTEHVRLAIIPNRERDLRDPKIIQHEQFLEGLVAHKERRVRECRKVEPAIEMPDWRIEQIREKYSDRYEKYGDPKEDFADSVGISRTGEL